MNQVFRNLLMKVILQGVRKTGNFDCYHLTITNPVAFQMCQKLEKFSELVWAKESANGKDLLQAVSCKKFLRRKKGSVMNSDYMKYGFLWKDVLHMKKCT